MKIQRGCKQPLQRPVWVIEDFQFFVCPLNWLSFQILAWSDEYKLIKKGICKQIEYSKIASKFFSAITIYEKYLYEFQKDKKQIDKSEKTFTILKKIKNDAKRK